VKVVKVVHTGTAFRLSLEFWDTVFISSCCQQVLAQLRALQGGDVLPTSAGKIDRSKTLFAR